MPDTLSSLRAEILNWMRGDYGQATDIPLVNSSINDAIESIWTSMMQVHLARFFGTDTPVTFTLASGVERVQLTSVTDPTVVPALANVAGGTLGARSYTVSYTFVTESGSETNPSPQTVFAATANNLAQTTAPANPGTAFGWNLYAGSTSGVMALQNQNPLPFGQPFLEPITGFQDYPTNQQQPPTSNSTSDNISWITHLEIITSDTLRRAWNQYDIDSEIMRRYARTLSSASEYQTYVWDLINGRVLEFRPPAGMTFNPRYFFVSQPRRLRYDQADIPYLNIIGVREFLVNKAVARLKLGLDEYLAVQAWSGMAEKAREEIVLALNQQNWRTNLRISPHLF